MVDKNCVKSVAKNSDFNEKELQGLFEEAQKQLDVLKKDNTKNVPKAMQEWAEKYKADVEREAFIKKRNTAYNALAKTKAIQSIKEQFPDDYAAGVEALLWGDGAKTEYSAAAMQKTYHNKWIGDFLHGFERMGEDAVSIVKSGEADREIAQAMYALKNNEPTADMNSTVVGIAKHINDQFEVIRKELNDAGAFIGAREDWMWKQVHDARKIRKAGRDKWEADFRENLDYEKTFGYSREQIGQNKELTEMVDQVIADWHMDLSTGNHLKASAETIGAGTGGGNIAKRLSQQRKIHFKGADGFFNYQQEYGVGSILETINMQARSSARDMGLMNKLGPDYEMNLKAITDDLTLNAKKSGSDEMVMRLDKRGRNRRMAMATVDGSIDIPGTEMFANVMGSMRAIFGMSRLGSASFAALSDLATIGSNSKVNGKGMLHGMNDAVQGLLPGTNNTELAKSLGITQDYLRGGILDDFNAVDAGAGKMAKAQELFFRLNLLGPMTNRHRASVAVGEASFLGEMSGVKLDALPIEHQRKLALSEIKSAEWDAIRSSIDADKAADGTDVRMATPESVRSLSDEAITSYLTAKGETVNAFTIKKARTDLENKLRAFYQDTIDSAVIEPTARTRGGILQGTQRGTIVGEALRSMMQFKSFPIAILRQRVARDIHLRTGGSATKMDAIKQVGAWGPAFAQFMIMSTVMGYGAMVLKDLAKGLTPRDPSDPNTVVAAMMQGGGIGIFGDFLFGEANRYGGGLTSTLVGPAGQFVNDVHGIYSGIFHSSIDGEVPDVAGKSLRLIYNNTPFANLFYIKPALDHFFMNELTEYLNPGSGERRIQRRLKETGQTSLYH